jgi:hypothetical protein
MPRSNILEAASGTLSHTHLKPFGQNDENDECCSREFPMVTCEWLCRKSPSAAVHEWALNGHASVLVYGL